MRLAFKLTAALIVGITLVMIANTLARVRREVDLFERDQEHDQRIMGWTLRNAIHAVWETEDEAHARAVLAMTDVGDLGLRWRWLDELRDDAAAGRDANASRILPMLAAGKEATLVRHAAAGDRRYTYVPMLAGHARPAVLELSELASPPRSFIRASILENVLSTTLIVFVCSVIALVLGVWMVGRPMRLLTAKARRVGAGDFTGPLALRQRDEIGSLAAEIDVTSDRLAEAQRRVAAETEARIATLEQLRHADRLKTIGQLASGVAHELGTPLNVVSGRADMILADPTPDTSATGARIILDQTERMTRIIRQLLDFARRRGPHPRPLRARTRRRGRGRDPGAVRENPSRDDRRRRSRPGLRRGRPGSDAPGAHEPHGERHAGDGEGRAARGERRPAADASAGRSRR